ncbi:MAG: rod shape-determining protein MreD [Candidatus Limnocylindria bacterium]|nr:rod shape-determining protein MreD [Candidatus Limnocylindria bacterium]
MRVVLALAVPLLAALLQGSVAPLVAIGGARPNLIVLVAGSWSVAAGAREAVWWAFVGGIAADLLSGGPLGAQALAALPAVAAIGLGDPARPSGLVTGAAAVGVAALVTAFLYVAILALAGQPLPSFATIAGDSAGGALFTAALALAAYPLARLARRGVRPPAAFGS